MVLFLPDLLELVLGHRMVDLLVDPVFGLHLLHLLLDHLPLLPNRECIQPQEIAIGNYQIRFLFTTTILHSYKNIQKVIIAPLEESMCLKKQDQSKHGWLF